MSHFEGSQVGKDLSSSASSQAFSSSQVFNGLDEAYSH